METEYNGWTNRETWCTNLWIDNEFGLYEQVQQMAKEEIAGHDEGEEINPYYLGEQIKEMFEELFDFESIVSNRELLVMMNDIGSLYRVNWKEIAENILDENKLQEAN